MLCTIMSPVTGTRPTDSLESYLLVTPKKHTKKEETKSMENVD